MLNGKTTTVENKIECIVTVDDNSGAHFNRDFTYIDLTNRYGESCKTSYFQVNPGEYHLWKSVPEGVDHTLPFVGNRFVFHRSKDHVWVMIIESFPIAGRIWIKFYNSGIWGDWNVHVPKIAKDVYPQNTTTK